MTERHLAVDQDSLGAPAMAAQSRLTSAPSLPLGNSLSSSDQARVNKRKGTRSVSSLTPAQLARKRANGREAQRAIRARTKDHIERLETELDELRNRDHTVQELMRRNRALEDELTRLRESMGILATSSPYATNIYDENMSTSSGAIPSPRTSPCPAGDDYVAVAAAAAANGQFADYSQAGHVHFPSTCEAWTAPAPAAAITSNVSSPSRAPAGTPNDLVHGAVVGHYLPSSAPMMGSSSGMGLRGAEAIKMEYVDGNDHGFYDSSSTCSRSSGGTPPMPRSHMLLPSFMHQQPESPWAMYPVYYPVPSTVH